MMNAAAPGGNRSCRYHAAQPNKLPDSTNLSSILLLDKCSFVMRWKESSLLTIFFFIIIIGLLVWFRVILGRGIEKRYRQLLGDNR